MRNTFVKLFLALAMCFMIGSALVACGGVSLSVSEDGYFVIDGEKTDVKAPANGAADCKHDVITYEVKAHTAETAGVYLETCKLCNDYAKVVEGETRHDYEDGVKQAATCLVDAFEGQVCKVCGARGEGKTETGTAGHKYSADRAIAKDPTVAACTNDAVVVKHCTVCFEVSEPEVVVGGIGHTADAWKAVQYPTLSAEGKVSGVCVYCNIAQELKLPVLSEENYKTAWKDGVEPTCYKGATQIFTYEAKNEIVTDEEEDGVKIWDNNLVFTTEEKIGPAEHVINGVPYTDFVNAEKSSGSTTVVNFFADLNEDGIVAEGEKVGFKTYAGAALNCAVSNDAYFKCEACAEIIDVDAYVDHNGPRKEVRKAYCYAPGEDEVTCVNCRATVDVETTVEHNFKYDLVPVYGEGEDADTIVSYTLTKTCQEKMPVEEEEDEDTTLAAVVPVATTPCIDGNESKTIPAALVTPTGKKQAKTCYADGWVEYVYTETVGTKEIDVKVQVSTGKAKHTLNGKKIDVNDVDNLDVSMPGIKAFAGTTFDSCETAYKAYFVCSVCAEAQKSDASINEIVEIPVIYRAHDLEKNVTLKPDCTNTGLQDIKCKYEGCGYEIEDDVIPADGHDYEITYTLSFNTESLWYDINVVGACKTAGCKNEDDKAEIEETYSLPAKSSEAYVVTPLTVGSCSAGAKVLYTVVIDLETGLVATVNEDESTKDNVVYNEKFATAIKIEDMADITVPHVFDPTKTLVTVVENDYNEDGIVDSTETITFSYCTGCNLYKAVKNEYKQITDIDATWQPEEEETTEEE